MSKRRSVEIFSSRKALQDGNVNDETLDVSVAGAIKFERLSLSISVL